MPIERTQVPRQGIHRPLKRLLDRLSVDVQALERRAIGVKSVIVGFYDHRYSNIHGAPSDSGSGIAILFIRVHQCNHGIRGSPARHPREVGQHTLAVGIGRGWELTLHRHPQSYEEEISAIPSELLKEPSEQLRHSNEMSDENGFVPIPSLVILEREASRKDGELGRFTEQAVGNEAMVI